MSGMYKQMRASTYALRINECAIHMLRRPYAIKFSPRVRPAANGCPVVKQEREQWRAQMII
eukprot:6196924-Pleurochrysis_carterae.AAC.2